LSREQLAKVANRYKSSLLEPNASEHADGSQHREKGPVVLFPNIHKKKLSNDLPADRVHGSLACQITQLEIPTSQGMRKSTSAQNELSLYRVGGLLHVDSKPQLQSLAEQPHHQVSKIPGAVAETQLPHRLYPSIGNTQQETFFS
jgi:hypothetical protein